MSDPLLPILDTFAELRASTPDMQGDKALSARPFPGRPRDRVAINEHGAPVILVHSSARQTSIPRTELAYLSVCHGVHCEIVHADGTAEEAIFSTVRFQGDASPLHDYFLRVVGAAVLGLPEHPSEQDVSKMVLRLAELFHALSQAPRQSAQGLWSEVFVIAQAADVVEAVRSWRESPEAPFDFSDGDEHVEVKSVVGEVRRHHFALKQLQPADGGAVTVISLLLRKSSEGTSLGELVNVVHSRLIHNPDVWMTFQRNVALTLGNSIASSMRICFDVSFAKTHVRFLDSASIPCISPHIPPEVSDVRFMVDLSSIDSVKSSANRSHLIDVLSL